MTTSTIQFASKEIMARKGLDLRAGDTVKVHVKIQERGKTRTQIFEGLVIARKHGSEAGATFTVRKVSNGVGVERIFPLYSPSIDKIEIVKRSRVRRSKLYYIREKVARDIRRKMRNFVQFAATTDDLEIPADEMVEEVIEETTENTEVASEAPATEEAPVTEEAVPAEEVATEEVSAEAEEVKEEVAEEAPVAEETTETAPEAETPAEEATEEKTEE